MIKVVALITRKPGMSREEFLRCWQEEHPALVTKLAGLRRYVQNPALDGPRDWPFDGVAELWFDSVHDVGVGFKGPAADALRAHEETFIGDISWFLAEEREIPLGQPDA